MEKRLPTHPGEILKEELEARNITQKQFAKCLDMSYTMLNEILNGRRPVTTDIALMMEAALGINPELLLNMQNRYNMVKARQTLSLTTRLNQIRKIAAVL
ncbi:MAG: HigA family addiction module antitoxin [Bacteroidaceae bacterium]|nr:HigA family addiction module antidote protein [Candidatus Minthousia equi]MCQ2245291.1 HigA family addiction module antitoxin [Bacteroidaceae bacterium]